MADPTLEEVRAYLIDHGPARVRDVKRGLAPSCECPDCGVVHTDEATRRAQASIERHFRALIRDGEVVSDAQWRYEVID